MELHISTPQEIRWSDQQIDFQRVISTKLAAIHLPDNVCGYCGGAGCVWCGNSVRKEQ